MATTAHIALPARVGSLIPRWHLLSLDAPTVAAVWVCFIARANHVQLPLAAPAAMALAVWMIYALDRLLDARHQSRAHARAVNELQMRHLFHYHHRRAFRAGIALAAAALTPLLHLLDPEAVRLYLIEGALLAAWLLILHATASADRLPGQHPAAQRLPKEIAVGLFFSAAIFIPTIARQPGLSTTLFPAAILFAALCSLNCLFIYAWEHDRPSHLFARPAHLTTRLAVAHLAALAIALALASTCVALLQSTSAQPIPAACALAAVLLLELDRNRHRLAANDLRAAADLALLTPLLLWPFLPLR